MKITYRLHAVERMLERDISDADVMTTIETGKIIEDYADDKPYPSSLILKFINNRPIHLVVADNVDDNEKIIITVYEPDAMKWNETFERRK